MLINKKCSSFAVMNKLMSTAMPPQFQLNVDGTQFCVGRKENGRIEVKYRERVDGKALKVLHENGDGGLRYSIKYYALIAAFGFACDPIFVLADNSMDREASDVHEVKLLGIANSMTDEGYVVFCSSRLGNGFFLGGSLLIYLFRTLGLCEIILTYLLMPWPGSNWTESLFRLSAEISGSSKILKFWTSFTPTIFVWASQLGAPQKLHKFVM